MKLFVSTLLLAGMIGSASADSGTAFFEQKVAPILKRQCYDCHSHESGKAKGGLVLDSRVGWTKGGGGGPAIVPGQVDKSLLIAAIRYTNEVLQMPPKQMLPAEEIALLEKWVAMGAPDPRKSQTPKIDPAKLWALKPVRQQIPPKVADQNWPLDESDRFLLADLDKGGLKPVAGADRHTLLRRVTFDLTGLPPTPKEIEAFIDDKSSDAHGTSSSDC